MAEKSVGILEQLERATSDEEMLVALSLLPKTDIDLEDCFGCIKWQFIHRLLISSDKEMSLLGLHIWTKFYEVGRTKSKWLKRIPAVVKLAEREDALQILISALSEKKSWGFYTEVEFDFIASLDNELSLFFVETLIDMDADMDLSVFLSTCARMMLRGDSLIFHALVIAVKLLTLPTFNSDTVFKHLFIFNLACRRLLSSKLSKKNTEAALVLIALLGDHSNQTFLDINPVDPKDIEREEKFIKEAEKKALLREQDVERLIENMENLQKKDPDDGVDKAVPSSIILGH